MIDVFIQNIDKVSPEEYNDFLLTLPKAMQKEVLKYREKEDRQRTLVGKMLLLNYLKIDTSFTLFDIEKSLYHKPFIPNSNISFNISHSGKYVVVACTLSNVIGIDVEEMKEGISIGEFKEVFSLEEYSYIKKSKEPLNTFYSLWTKKEALLKAEGKGLLDDIQAVKISEDKIVFKNRKYFTLSYELNNHLISLVYKNIDEINWEIDNLN